MNKENSFQSPQSSSPEITAEQKARISQNFRAAKALLARKCPFYTNQKVPSSVPVKYERPPEINSFKRPCNGSVSDRDYLKNEQNIGSYRVPLSNVDINTPSSVLSKCGSLTGSNSIKQPYDCLKDGDNTVMCRLPSFTPSKCGLLAEIDSVRSCPERISRKKDEGFGSHGPKIVKMYIDDKSVAASTITLSKQSEICKSIPKESGGDNVSYGLGILDAPGVDGHVSNSFVTPMRQSECANLSDAFSLAADLDDDFDETILKEIDALCEEKSARKLKQNDSSSGISHNDSDDVGRISLESVSIENVTESESTLESGDKHELLEERSDNIHGFKTGSFPQAYADYLQSLNDQQKEAACSDISTPLMIVAGPGSDFNNGWARIDASK